MAGLSGLVGLCLLQRLQLGTHGHALGAGCCQSRQGCIAHDQVGAHGLGQLGQRHHHGSGLDGLHIRVHRAARAAGKGQQHARGVGRFALLYHGIEHGLIDLQRGRMGQLVGVRQQMNVALLCAIAAGLANAGQRLAGHLLGKLARLGFAAAQDQGIEAGFADRHFRILAR